MKQTLLTLYMMAVAAVCAAQPKFTSNTEMQNLGQIEWKHPADVQYVISNTGTAPLVLTGIEPDCACTVAQWTKTPIAPGGKGTVRLTFDAEALGRFHKSVAILTNAAPHVIYLYFQGEVVRHLTDFSRTHPYQIGQIRIDRNAIDFPDVALGGGSRSMHIGVVNLSDNAYEPVLMHLPSYIDMEASPSVLPKGGQGTLTLTLHPERLSDMGVSRASVYLSRFTGDKVSKDNELPLTATLLPDFTGMTESERLNAPHIDIDTTAIDMKELLEKKHKARKDIEMTNTGHTPLHIIKLQVLHPALGIRLKKNVLQPGESTRLRVTVSKRNAGKHHRHQEQLKLIMITNDPTQPKIAIDIKTK